MNNLNNVEVRVHTFFSSCPLALFQAVHFRRNMQPDNDGVQRAQAFVSARRSFDIPIDDEYKRYIPQPDAFITHALEPAANNPSFLKKKFVYEWKLCSTDVWASTSSMGTATLYTATLVAGALSFVSQEWASAQSLLTVNIKACASPFIAALSNYSRANCVSDLLVSCASSFAGTNPDFGSMPLSLTYRQTLHMQGFTIMLITSAALLAGELIYLQASIARRQNLAARILPYYAYLKHVRLPCTVEPWYAARGGGQCLACCGGRCRCNRWCGIWCCGRSVPLTTVLPQLAIIGLLFLAYYGFKTLSVYNIVTQNAWQPVVETVMWQGSALRVNTVLCSLANGTMGAPLRLLLDVDGATTSLLGGGTLVFSVFPQVLFAVMLVLLAFIPQLVSIYSEDGDVLAGVPLRGFVHCLDAKVGSVCGHHELLARPDDRHNPGLLALGVRGSVPAVLEPARFYAVDEALLDEVLWDLLAARGDKGGVCGPCARRLRFFTWPASGKDVDAGEVDAGVVDAGVVLLEAALRTAHEDEPVDDKDERIKAIVQSYPRREERMRKLAEALSFRDARHAAAQAAGPAAEAATLNPLLSEARRRALPPGWTEVVDGGEMWYAHDDGRTQWAAPSGDDK